MTPELQKAVVEGVMGMVALRLRGSPSTDTAAVTAKLWIAAIASRPISWDTEQDLPRINRAFIELAATAEAWPSPAEFLRMLPPRPQRLSLPDKTNRSISPGTRKMLDELVAKMKGNTTSTARD